jgi:hypothetical protein
MKIWTGGWGATCPDTKSNPCHSWLGGIEERQIADGGGKRFDVLLTMDSKMFYQQKLVKYKIAVIALKARSKRLADTRPLMSKVLAALGKARAGTLLLVS